MIAQASNVLVKFVALSILVYVAGVFAERPNLPNDARAQTEHENSTSPLTLHMPDASDLKPNEYDAALDLRPRSLLVMVYAQWSDDDGAAEQNVRIVHELHHSNLYVRFHADPNPVGYSRKIGGAYKWGQLCAIQMTHYYGGLELEGVQLHALLANEYDAQSEGNLSARDASTWLQEAFSGYESVRPQDILHVPATTGSPVTLRAYLEQYRNDGWLSAGYVIDGHGYGSQVSQVVDVMEQILPSHLHMISEFNHTGSMEPLARMVSSGRLSAASYFILNWARGGVGRLQVSDQDRNERISLMRWRDSYDEFRRTVTFTEGRSSNNVR